MANRAARSGKELLSARTVAALINAADAGKTFWRPPNWKADDGEGIPVFRRHPDGEDLYLTIKSLSQKAIARGMVA